MVKCSECGFLASRDVNSRQLEETEQEIRQEGHEVMAVNTGKIWGKYEPPICFMRAPDYKAFPLSPIDTQAVAIKLEIQRERTCELFVPWHQGFTPKEHREMLDRERLLQWQGEQEEKDRVFRQQESKVNRHYRIAELVLVVITIIAILVTAFIGRGEQPIINITTENPAGVTIEQQP